MKDAALLNFDDAKARQMAVEFIRSRRGPHWFDVRKARATRTLSQNAFYWGCILVAVAAGITEAWGETFNADDAHLFCRDRFLKRPVVNRATGEVEGGVARSTASLTTEEFAAYIDQIIAFAAESLGVEIPPPMQLVSKQRVRQP